MRAMVLREDRKLELREIPDVVPAEGQVRLRVAACGVCGSDLHLRHSLALPAGEVMGHEFSGTLDALGAGVTGWSEGDRVAVFPFPPTPVHDMAAALQGLGCGGGQGGLADAVCVGTDRLWRVPDSLPLEYGALVEPLAVALHGLTVAEVRPENACVVVGAGPIGVLTSLALRARGVERICVVELNASRRDRMARLGFAVSGADDVHAAVPAALDGLPARVFECAGRPAASALALELVAPSGIVALMGMHEEAVPLSQLLLMLKEAQLRASFIYRPGDFDEALGLLVDRRVDPADLVSRRAPFTEADAVMDSLERPDTDDVKVLLDVAV